MECGVPIGNFVHVGGYAPKQMQACGGGGGGVGWQLASQAVWFVTLPGVPPGTTRHVGLGMVRSHRYSSGRVSVQLGPAHPGSQMHCEGQAHVSQCVHPGG